MISDAEMIAWSPSDPKFFADNTLGDWNNTMSDLQFGVNDFMSEAEDSGFYDSEMLSSDQLTPPLIDEWLHIPPALDLKIKEEPLSPGSPGSSLPSSPECQSIAKGQSSPVHQPPSPAYQPPNLDPLTLPGPVKSEPVVSPSSCIKQEPSVEQPCALSVNQPRKLLIPAQTSVKTQSFASVPVSTVSSNVTAPATVAGTQFIISNNVKYIPVNLSKTTPGQTVVIPAVCSVPPTQPSKPVNPPCNISVKQEEVDAKQLKRQQRMIKNRESACLSRRKKKEYLQSLESKIKEINTEKERLQQENLQLKSRIQCLVQENDLLRSQNPQITSTVKRSGCVLVFMLFIMLNLGPISNLKNFGQEESVYTQQGGVHHGRALLQFSRDSLADNQLPMRSKSVESFTDSRLKDEYISKKFARQKFIPHFTKSEVSEKPEVSSHSSQAQNQSKEEVDNAESANVCPTYFNRTEVSRLNGVLEGFVKGHEVDRSKQMKKTKKKVVAKNVMAKLAEQIAANCTKSKKEKEPSRIPQPTKKYWSQPSQHAVQLYAGRDSYQNLQQALNTKDDTFYVISLRRDHLMLPAKEYNETRRPKMSFMMLAPSSNETSWKESKDFFSMLQIDCEVMDTKTVKLKKTVFPESFLSDGSVFSQTFVKSPFETFP